MDSLGATIVRKAGQDLRNDTGLIDAMRSMLVDSYVVPDDILGPEIEKCETCYLHIAGSGDVTSFFLVSRGDLGEAHRPIPSVYLGLSATSQQTKNSGTVRALYRAFVSDAREWEKAAGLPFVLWYTTATPSACLAAYAIFANAAPRLDGTFSAEKLPIVAAIKRSIGYAGDCADHPFVLRSLFRRARYSEGERERIAAVCRKHGFSLLDDLGIDERQGDRLLYICDVPSPDSLPFAPKSATSTEVG